MIAKVEEGEAFGSMAGGQTPAFVENIIEGWFTSAITTTLAVAVIVCLAGAVSAVFIPRPRRPPDDAARPDGAARRRGQTRAAHLGDPGRGPVI